MENFLIGTTFIAIILGSLWWLERSERQRLTKDLSDKIEKLALALQILNDHNDQMTLVTIDDDSESENGQ